MHQKWWSYSRTVMCATFAINTMKHYCDGEEHTLRLLKAGIPCGSCWSREAVTSPANGCLCWLLALLEQGDKVQSSFWFANSIGEWRITCYIFRHNPLAIYFSLLQNPLFFLCIHTLLFCLVCVPYHAWNGFKFCPGVFHIDVNSLQQKNKFLKNTPIVWF